MKKTLLFTATASAAVSAACILQYIFTDAPVNQILRYCIYALLGIGAIAALIVYFKGSRKELVCRECAAGGKSAALLSIFLAMLIMAESGIYFGRWIKQFNTVKPFEGFSALAPLGALAGIYFALLALELKSEKPLTAAKIFGVFPPVFVCARGIEMFFESFKMASRVEVRLEMLAVCMTVLFVVALTASRAGADVGVRRLKAVCILACVFTAAASLPGLVYDLALSSETLVFEDLLWYLQLLIIWLLSFMAIIRAYVKEPVIKTEEKAQAMQETESEAEPKLDIYINEIPAEPSEDGEE